MTEMSTIEMLSANRLPAPRFPYSPMAKAGGEVFDANGPLPSRAAIGVSALPLNGGVEIEFSFYKGEQP